MPICVPAPLRRLIDHLPQPAYVTGRRWDILAWNQAADDVFAFSRLPEADRNILVCVLTNPHTKQLFGTGWQEEAKRIVAQFRATHDLLAGDPTFLQLLHRLGRDSPEFRAWWEAHDIRASAAGRKLLHHPKLGSLRFDHASFQANDDPALRLVIYTPVHDG